MTPSPCSPVLACSTIACMTSSTLSSETIASNFVRGIRSYETGCPLHWRWSSLSLLHPETVETVIPPIPICRNCSFTSGIRSALIMASILFISGVSDNLYAVIIIFYWVSDSGIAYITMMVRPARYQSCIVEDPMEVENEKARQSWNKANRWYLRGYNYFKIRGGHIDTS